jgi:hypothetical protein
LIRIPQFSACCQAQRVKKPKIPSTIFEPQISRSFSMLSAYTKEITNCKGGGYHMIAHMPNVGDIDDLIFQDSWVISER